MDDYEYEKYACTKNTLKKTLSKYGVAIIPNVINKKEIKAMNNGVWNYLENITESSGKPIKRNDKKTWREYFNLFPKHSMLMQHFSIGHAQYIWDLRQNEKIVNVFASLWKVKPEELLVSFDGASFHLPPEDTKRGWNKNNVWLHTDQSYTRNKFECAQAWVTGYDVNDGDSTLTFLEGSHKYHKDFKKHFKITDKSDWFKLDDKQIDYYIKTKKCSQKYIKCPAGSLVFWDSRTIHSGSEALKERPKKNFRNVVYICMTPREFANQHNIKKKKYAFDNLRTTNHYPHKVKLFAKNPRTYGQELPNVKSIAKPKLTKLGEKLAGF